MTFFIVFVKLTDGMRMSKLCGQVHCLVNCSITWDHLHLNCCHHITTSKLMHYTIFIYASPFRHLTSTVHTVLLDVCIHFSAHINMMQYLHCMRKPTLHKLRAYFGCAVLDISLSKILGPFIRHWNWNKSHHEFCPH